MKRSNARFLLVILLALALRFTAAFLLGNEVSGLSGAHDEITYSQLGFRAATGHGLTFPESWYPWINANEPQSYFSASLSLTLAGIYFIFGYEPLVARLLFSILGVGVVALIYLLARRLFGEKIAFLSGIIAAAYSYLIFYSATLVTETPFIFFMLLAILKAHDLRHSSRTIDWVILGLSLSLAILFRMAVVFFVPFLILWIMFEKRKFVLKSLIPFAIIFASLLPFTIHNYRLWGRFLLLEAQFGHVFWNGNNPGHEGNFHPYRVFPIPKEVLASRNDAEINSRLLRMGIHNVIEDPVHFTKLTLTRLREFFTFWPTHDSSLPANLLRIISSGIMLPFAAVGLYLSRRKWRDLLPFYLFMLIHTGVYSVSWTMIRYRIPLDAILIAFSALAIISLYEKVRRGCLKTVGLQKQIMH